MYTFENTFKDDDLKDKERIYFRRHMIYSILELYNGWKEPFDSIPDYVKINGSGRNKVLLLTIEDFDIWAGLK